MSETRKVRSELRQALHQILMSLYQEYRLTNGDDESRKLIIDSLNEQYELFGSESKNEYDLSIKVLQKKIQELKTKLDSSKDHETSMYHAEQIDILEESIRILKIKS
ncbi:hypothetical protein KLEB273_gp146 [Bacillus phage vB_BauM_KLEB27-3]|nr:hypothetical protein KLEB273_gp146 [Bacillus phage vB_BauM_KLEB27-3]